MKVRFLEPAGVELEEAVQWYNDREEGLGEELRAAVKNAVDLIIAFPEGWTEVSKNTRRCPTRRFPYAVIYQQRPDTILIVAVAHLRRRAGYWRDRVKD